MRGTGSWENIEVVELLKHYAELAQRIPFSQVSIALVGQGKPNSAMIDTAGDVRLEGGAQEALEGLLSNLGASSKNRLLPDRDLSLDASYVCFDTATGPLSFDFITWLVTQEMTRVREDAPGPLKVGFWQGNGDVGRNARRELWLNNVFRPALGFIGAVEDDRAIRGRSPKTYVTRDIVAAARNGEPVPTFKPQRRGTLPKGAVTITLREATFWSHRNSNLDAWLKFARELRDEGERVVFVRDVEMAHEPIGDFVTCPEASLDLNARLELYEDAICNLFVSNGPSELAWFGSRPWLMFVPIEPDDSYFGANTVKFWKDKMGVVVGDQFPWSSADQRVVFAPDTHQNIAVAWYANFMRRAA